MSVTAIVHVHSQLSTVYPAYHQEVQAEVNQPFDELYTYGQLVPTQYDHPAFVHDHGQHLSVQGPESHSIHLFDQQPLGEPLYPESQPLFNDPTPDGGQVSEPTTISISVSTAFHPNAHPHLPAVDTIFVSIDGVIFYVNSEVILKTCRNAFKELLGSRLGDSKFRHTPVPVDAQSAELNVILHLLYGTSPAAHSPSFEVLQNAADRMPQYSILPCKYIVPTSPLYTLLLSVAPLQPMDVYVLAAHHKLHDLAVATSSHLLSYSLRNITEAQAERMGAIYLKKLMDLHLSRLSALKTILLSPPQPHSPTRQCSFQEQRKLTRAWALASAYIVWDSRLDFSTYNLQSALQPLLEELDCNLCKESLQTRIKEIIVRWTSVERTI